MEARGYDANTNNYISYVMVKLMQAPTSFLRQPMAQEVIRSTSRSSAITSIWGLVFTLHTIKGNFSPSENIYFVSLVFNGNLVELSRTGQALGCHWASLTFVVPNQ